MNYLTDSEDPRLAAKQVAHTLVDACGRTALHMLAGTPSHVAAMYLALAVEPMTWS